MCIHRRVTRAVGHVRDRGAVLLLLALFLGIFLAVAALAVDLSAIAARGQALQNTADAAALAGVVEYEQQLNNGATETEARTAAEALVSNIAEQNGFDLSDLDVFIDVSFPSGGGGLVTVSITDEDPQTFLGETVIPGFDARVNRQATAEFLACDPACNITVDIPKPFTSVSAAGQGDGYKPIPVGGKLYAINHNNTDQNIVCVDRSTQQPCWLDSAGDPQAARPAYDPSIGFNDRNPEMPHAAVVGTRIYWSATDNVYGHRLFCWETLTDVPCSNAFPLAPGLLRIDKSVGQIDNDKDENRGGGTVAVDNKVYAFTDDNRIHCFDPATGSVCTLFVPGGLPTGTAVFPANDPMQGNHGSSIDRIVDEQRGYIYSVMRVVNVQPTPPADCVGAVSSSNIADFVDQVVIFRNPVTGNFLAAAGADDVVMSGSSAAAGSQWRVILAPNGTLYFDNQLVGEVLDGVAVGDLPDAPNTDGDTFEPDDAWNLVSSGGGFLLQNNQVPSYVNEVGSSAVQEDSGTSGATVWEISICSDPASDLGYSAGTWLHCYNTGVISGVPSPCTDFVPRKIHNNASRFSGRLWFFYSPTGAGTPNKIGVCSSGFSADSASTLEINCYPILDGLDPTVPDATMNSAMSSVASAIQGSTGSNPGAWGDPHWNDYTNRLFYPTEHDSSLVICWDFDTGWCGSIVGQTPPSATGGMALTEDYGFFSEDNCVYGLGHNAFFWAFKAEDIYEPCTGATSEQSITPCPCSSGSQFRWGRLDFGDIDLTDFDVFNLRITTDPDNDGDPSTNGTPPVQLFPIPDPAQPNLASYHSLKPGGASPLIDLDELGIAQTLPSIKVVVYVEAENDPFDVSVPQFTIAFLQRPRLIE